MQLIKLADGHPVLLNVLMNLADGHPGLSKVRFGAIGIVELILAHLHLFLAHTLTKINSSSTATHATDPAASAEAA